MAKGVLFLLLLLLFGNSYLLSASLTICSFNIKFLGNYKDKDNAGLASVVGQYDIVVIQELVAPAYNGTFPSGKSYKFDQESTDFFDLMEAHGFNYVLSREDTGPKDDNHKNNTSTEWWVAFYKPDIVTVASELPSGFLSEDRTNNENFDRVPYAFAFRTQDATMDFVLIRYRNPHPMGGVKGTGYAGPEWDWP